MGDCVKCKEGASKLQRQSLGCGYEPLTNRVRLALWMPRGYEGDAPTVCPGYTCALPEIGEVALAHVHWSKGNHNSDDEDLRDAIVIYDGGINGVQSWLMKPASEGGGGR